jgi:hypothetical protein
MHFLAIFSHPIGQWRRCVAKILAQFILHGLGEYLGYSPPPSLERLIEGAQEIQQQRPMLQETLATAP